MCWVLTPHRRCDLQISFSHSIGCLFVWSMVSSTVRKLCSLTGCPSCLFSFLFTFFFGVRATKTITKTRVREPSAYLFFLAFYGVQSYIQAYNSCSSEYMPCVIATACLLAKSAFQSSQWKAESPRKASSHAFHG